MGMEKYEGFVRCAKSTLVYTPGWSHDNITGGWRTVRPVIDFDRCNSCDLCWLYCPEGSIERKSYDINMTYCKGCGICAVECKRDAIAMEREGE